MTGIAAVCGRLSPDAAIVLFTGGVLLVFLELNRPGSIVPGAVGLLMALCGLARLAPLQHDPRAAGAALTGVLVLLLGLRRDVPRALQAAAVVCLCKAFWLAAPTGPRLLHATVSTVCGTVLGVSAAWLTRVARRARVNKGLD